MKNLKNLFSKTLVIFSLLVLFASCKKDKVEQINQGVPLNEFTIDGTAMSSYWTTPNNATPSPENDQAKAFISFTDNRVYNYTQALTDQSKIDMVLGTSYYRKSGAIDQYTAGSIGLQVSSMYSGRAFSSQTNGRKITDFITRKVFYLKKHSDYINIKTVKDLDEIFSKLKDDDFEQSDAFIDNYGGQTLINNLLFKTAEGKRGIMKLNSYNSNKPFIYSITIKIEK